MIEEHGGCYIGDVVVWARRLSAPNCSASCA